MVKKVTQTHYRVTQSVEAPFLSSNQTSRERRETHTYTHKKYNQSSGDRRLQPVDSAQMGSTSYPHSFTGSTANERGPPLPKITTLLEPGASSDFMSAAARLIYSRSAPTYSHRRPGNPSLTPIVAHPQFYLLNINAVPQPCAFLTHSATQVSTGALSAGDKEGQTEIQAKRLH